MFHEAITNAAVQGIAKIVKNGLAFTIMLGVIAGLLYALTTVHAAKEREVRELKAEMKEAREMYEREIHNLRRGIDECNQARAEDGARIARLETIVERLQGH